MFSGFTIDHAQFIADLAGWWSMLNPGGITATIINLLCGAVLAWMFFNLNDGDEDSNG